MYIAIRPEKLLSILLICVALVLASGCSHTPQQKEAGFLENGRKQLLREDYARAALQFRNAIQMMPADSEAYYQLGLAELAGGDITAAVTALRSATEVNPAHAGAQVKLAELMALSGIKDVARDGKKRMQDVLRNSPDNVDALDALSLNELQLGNWQDAETHLQEALDRFPQSVKSAVALARLDLQQRDLKGAEKVLQNAVKDSPQSAEAATALGDIYMLSGEWGQAEGQFHAAINIDPHFALGLIGLASAQGRLGQEQQAGQTWRTISALPEKKYRHLYAVWLFEQGKRDSAIEEFERLVRRDPGDRDARTRLVAAYLLMNQTEKAEVVLSAALRANPRDVDALLARSQLLLRSGKQKEAESDLMLVMRYQPDSARAHYLLAKVHQARGDSFRQRQALNDALRFDPTLLEARLDLAQALIEMKSATAALDILNAAPLPQQRILGLVIQRNWALLALDDQRDARKGIALGLLAARVPELFVQDSILKLKQHDYAGARAAAAEALKRNPDDLRALQLLAASYTAQKQNAEALRALELYASQHPGSAAIQQFVGEKLLAAGDLPRARAALVAAKAANPHSTPVDLDLARLDVSEGKPDEARQTLSRVLASDSASLDAHLWLGAIDMKAGNTAAAIQHFRAAVQVDDTNVPALNNLAYLLANTGKNADEALAFAQRAHELAPDNLDTEGTLGWVLYRKGLYKTALQYLQDAVEKDGHSSTRNAALRKQHLALVYVEAPPPSPVPR